MHRRTFLATTAAGLAGMGELARALPLKAVAPLPQAGGNRIRLNSNENPLGLPQSARRALIDGLSDANRYPFESQQRLHRSLARGLSIAPESLFIGNGSAEVIYLFLQAFHETGGSVLTARPTFEVLAYFAETRGLQVRRLDLASDFSHPISRMEEIVSKSDRPTLAYVCNPNNPTGSLTSCQEVQAWLKRAPESLWLLIDEAYYEYVRDPSYFGMISEAIRRPNTLVVRTFSKIYAMAGLRLGYGAGHPETIKRLGQLATDMNVNHAALCAGAACFGQRTYLDRSFRANQESKSILEQKLSQLEIEYLPSHTNFVMHRIKGGIERYIQRMSSHGISVGRRFPPMESHCRVSLGNSEEMRRYAQTLDRFRGRGWI